MKYDKSKPLLNDNIQQINLAEEKYFFSNAEFIVTPIFHSEKPSLNEIIIMMLKSDTEKSI